MKAWRLALPALALGVVVLLAVGIGLVVATTVGGGLDGSGGLCDPGVGLLGDGTGGIGGVSIDLDAQQRDNATTIIGVAKGMNVPPRAALVALATALQESTLHNYSVATDHDSLGLFQQRPSQGWGTPAQLTDPVYAATAFLDHLLAIPGWEQLPVTVAAQLVQRSAFPTAYAKWEGLAGDLLTALGGIADPIGCALAGSALALPAGIATAAISFALGELGKPYVWGATGPGSYDCSGLVLRAFQAAGIILPRTAREQYWAGAHLPVAQAQPGDLLFWAYNPDDPATIHHVALYLGNNQIAEAPDVGLTVRTRTVSFTEHELVPLATRPGTRST